MSADSIKIREILADQLSELDDSLGATVDDVKMLADLQQGIGQLLSDNSDAEREIRSVLQERFESGGLRKETYQLVKSMLDRFVTEQVPTSPSITAYEMIDSAPPDSPPPIERPQELDEPPPEPVDDEFSSTAVLPTDHFQEQSADDRVQVGSVLRDRFLLQERVSGGSMGVVYKALDRRLAEAGADIPSVAIKILTPQLAQSGSALRALQQEAAKGRCLTHPNIVRFIDLDRDDDLYFIIMEWLEGRTLADILDSADAKSIDVNQALNIVRQVGMALDYAHKCGIVHADVKPGNIMISPDGSAHLFDFGVARIQQSQADNDEFDPGVLGALTPAYSSMQVLTGDEPVPADDVFSLACLLYRLVAGYRVFGPRNAAEAAEEGMKPQRLKALTDAQWKATKKAISFARVTRYASAAEFVEALGGSKSSVATKYRDEPEVLSESINVDIEERLSAEPEQKSHFGLYMLVLLIAAAGFAAYHYDIYDRALVWIDERTSSGEVIDLTEPLPDVVPEDVLEEFSEPDVLDEVSEVVTDVEALPEESASEDSFAQEPEEILIAEPEPEPVASPITDFSLLPVADVEISLVESGTDAPPIAINLRESDGPVTVDLFRTASLDVPLRIRVEEISYSGNRSPWASRQYSISETGVIEIPAGQDRARIELVMANDPLREADQVSTLRIREADYTNTQLASIEVVLEDDDQRSFESRLPANAIGFAVSQVSVGEQDPVAQIDILRFNPDGQSITVEYAVRDVTATEGEDYFAPGSNSITFGPGQRSARLLIPLVQDNMSEGDEAFRVELSLPNQAVDIDVYQNIIVMIRDDEIAR